jgi:preprotein translocase subunit SecA
MVLLHTLDGLWREHLVTMEHLRSVIGLRGYGQRDPLNEYKAESFELFEAMLGNLREQVTGTLMHFQVTAGGLSDELLQPVELPPMQAHHSDPYTGEDELALADAALAAGARPPARGGAERRAPVQSRKGAGALDPSDPSTWGKVSRNAVCPCGSGKKYKHCHGKHD